MRAVELIGCRVVDRDGRPVGVVHDLRLVAGPQTRGLAGYRLDALLTGRGAVGGRLGYTSGEVTGPWPLPRLFRWLAGHSCLVPWREVAELDGRVIRLRCRADDLASLDEGTVDEGTVDEGTVDEGTVDEGTVDEGRASSGGGR